MNHKRVLVLLVFGVSVFLSCGAVGQEKPHPVTSNDPGYLDLVFSEVYDRMRERLDSLVKTRVDSIISTGVLRLDPDGDGRYEFSFHSGSSLGDSSWFSWNGEAGFENIKFNRPVNSNTMELYSARVRLKHVLSANGANLEFFEGSANGTDNIRFTCPASLAVSTTYTLPPADGSKREFLSTNGAGGLYWSKQKFGVGMVALTDNKSCDTIVIRDISGSVIHFSDPDSAFVTISPVVALDGVPLSEGNNVDTLGINISVGAIPLITDSSFSVCKTYTKGPTIMWQVIGR